MIKYVVAFFAVMLCIVGFTACNNDLDLVEEGGDIPVVYALLRKSNVDTAQYFRVERGFIDKEISGLVIAQNPDSLYYQDAQVTLTNKQRNESYNLTRVDGNLEGYARDEGVFAQAPNYLYKILNSDINFDEGAEYELTVNRGDNLAPVTASTLLLEDTRITRPNEGQILSMSETGSTLFKYLPGPNAKTFDVQMVFNFVEIKDNVSEQKSIVWNMAKNTDQTEISKNAIDFFGFVSSKIDEDPNVIRIFQNIDFKVIAGSQEVANYLNIVQANLGITSSQEIPTYSNLSEGYGLFANINETVRVGIPLNNNTLDSLRNGRFTSKLNFQ